MPRYEGTFALCLIIFSDLRQLKDLDKVPIFLANCHNECLTPLTLYCMAWLRELTCRCLKLRVPLLGSPFHQFTNLEHSVANLMNLQLNSRAMRSKTLTKTSLLAASVVPRQVRVLR